MGFYGQKTKKGQGMDHTLPARKELLHSQQWEYKVFPTVYHSCYQCAAPCKSMMLNVYQSNVCRCPSKRAYRNVRALVRVRRARAHYYDVTIGTGLYNT